MPVIAIPDFIIKLLELFAPIFSIPQFENFRTYIIGLIVSLESRNILDIANSNFIYEKNQSSLNRNFTESRWDENQLQQLSYEILKEYNLQNTKISDNKPRCFIILDDIVMKKYGKNIQGADYFYSHKEGKEIWGINIFAALVIVEGQPFPMLFKVQQYFNKKYCKENKIEFQTKINMAIKVIQEFEGFAGYQVIVLADSWYADKKLISTILKKGYDWCFATRSNRKIVNKSGKKIKVSKLAKSLHFSNYKRYEVGERIFWATSRVTILPKIGTVRLVLSKEQTKGKNKKDVKFAKTKFIATNLVDLADEQILQTYSVRSKIENTFKELKLHLGLNDCQMIISNGIKKHFACVQAGYNFVYTVALYQNIKDEVKTIGEICSYIKNQFLMSALKYFCDLVRLKKKFNIDKIFKNKKI